MKTAVRVLRDTYLDSVRQLLGARAMGRAAGVEWATAVMATPANLDSLRQEGFEIPQASPYDLVLAVRADDPQAAFAQGEQAMFGAPEGGGPVEEDPRCLDEALRRRPGTSIAVISVPGDYAALEAHKALSRDLDVLLFSDNVGLADEIALKEHAIRRGRLLMGPGAGTAMLAGVGLGFANVVRPGPVGVVAAAGTGAQEVMCLLDRAGVGLSQVIGVGGRDLTRAVGGRMAAHAVRMLDDDPATELILLVSKPPDEQVARRVVAAARRTPVVAVLVGVAGSTLEGGVVEALELLGRPVPSFDRCHGPSVGEAVARLAPARTTVRGLFSGGTLCYEALVLLSGALGPVWSNTPIDARYRLPAPPRSHVCLDLGEEDYTRGRPHPMIDPEARAELLRQSGPEVAVVLLDVVLGLGAHPDPAGILAPELAGLDGPQPVAYVLGTEQDPQGYQDQVRKLAEAGCVVTATAARAALTAAAIATRKAAS
ncbi:FdrA family protein [Nonomuraea sediminis]|uniref:FdrA family protein n=1 Tax=Nonomuraea sediminis TaxID=2835864 RepID=UPI0027DF99B7|nr:FdrA family protein [Nonomuraea sediminis]